MNTTGENTIEPSKIEVETETKPTNHAEAYTVASKTLLLLARNVSPRSLECFA